MIGIKAGTYICPQTKEGIQIFADIPDKGFDHSEVLDAANKVKRIQIGCFKISGMSCPSRCGIGQLNEPLFKLLRDIPLDG